MSSRSGSRSRNPRVQRERQEYRPEGSERISTPEGLAERGWVQVYIEDMIQRANNYTKQLYDKVDDLGVEVDKMESSNQTWIGPNGLMRKQANEHKNIIMKLTAIEKKVAVIEKAQVDKKIMAKNFKRLGDLEKKVTSLEGELNKCCTKSARTSSRRSSKSSSTRSSRRSSKSGSTRSSKGSNPKTRRRRRGLSFDSNDTYDSDTSYTSDQQERMYRAQV